MRGLMGLARSSIAQRLALMFSAAAFIVFALLGMVLHNVLFHELSRYQYDEVLNRMGDVRYFLENGRPPVLAQTVREKLEALSTVDSRTHFWLWSIERQYCYGDGAEQLAQLFAAQNQPGRLLKLSVNLPGKPSVVFGVILPANDVRPAVALMSGVFKQPLTHTLHFFQLWLFILTMASAALVAVFGYWITLVGLRPLARMSTDASSVGPDNPGKRLALSPLPHELLHLGQSFNAALNRLDGAYRRLETFNADVAHELRTPLNNMIGQTQVALSRQRQAQELREVLISNLEESERMRSIVSDMLFLARAAQGERAHEPVLTSIASEVGKTIEFFEVVLEEAGLKVLMVGDAQAPIDSSLFRRALTNLLQNAIQHSWRGDMIEVKISTDDTCAIVSMSNPGGEIAPEHLPRIFDRFYRVDSSRRNSDESHGLGLAIVKAVAQMHRGQVFASSQGGIVTVGFSVALAQSADHAAD